MSEIEKEVLVKFLMEKDEVTLKTAIAYAEAYLRYGVDVTEKWDTATKQAYSLERAYRDGYCKGINELLPKIRELEDKLKSSQEK